MIPTIQGDTPLNLANSPLRHPKEETILRNTAVFLCHLDQTRFAKYFFPPERQGAEFLGAQSVLELRVAEDDFEFLILLLILLVLRSSV